MYVLIRGCIMLALGFTLLLLVAGELPGVSGDEQDCDVKNAGTCYKIIVDHALGTDYASATSSCNGLGYKIAEIPNLTVQTAITKFLRQKMTEINRKNWVRAWIGSKINSAGVVTPPIPDGKWYPTFPMRSHRNFQWTNIYLHVNPNPAMKYQGMINTYPNYKTNGVVCQFVPPLCPAKHETKCFFPVTESEVDYDGGVAICKDLGGHLANIYSQTHMDDVMKYIREYRMGDSTFLGFRLGMKYDPGAEKLTLRDGTDAPAGLKWFTGYPHNVEAWAGYAGYSNVFLYVESEQSSANQYLINNSPLNTASVLCEIK